MSHRKLLFAVAGLMLSAVIFACRWDRDTLVHEAQEMPDAIQVASGRFERNPPLYYRMRIDRESVELRQHPDRLGLYDDLGVACDCLGDDDAAIRWMELKHTRMGDLAKARTLDGKRDAFSEAAYRYFANAGTFWVHRWVRSGAKKETVGQALHARDLIASAIAINPDAHFGRETVQLQVMDWLIASRLNKDPKTLGDYLNDQLEKIHGSPERAVQKNVKGLIGLIVLGNGWESPDMFEALASAIGRIKMNESKLAMFVSFRERELLDQGKVPFVPDTFVIADQHTPYVDEARMRSEFKRLRREADQWSENRTAFMLARLKQGRHPDTDRHFWDGYVSQPAPHVEYGLLDSFNETDRLKVELVACCSSPFVLLYAFLRISRKVRMRPGKGV
jgi:hypothetical protein